LTEKGPKIPVAVSEILEVTPLIKRFRLAPLGDQRLPVFSGGAHVVVEMRDGEVLRRNPYSLMSSPADVSSYTISVRRDDGGRGGSLFMHNKVREGTELVISHPVNLFPVDRRARKHIMFAGGIGITPFLAMMAQMAEEHRQFELHYAVRSDDHAAYAKDLRALYGRRINLYRDDQAETIPLAALLGNQPLGTHLYVCGPAGMIEWVLSTGRALGWPEQSLHHERFLAPATGKPYEVTLALSGRTIRVGPEQSMLEALEAAGIDAPYMCRGGACGQCECKVLSFDGTLLHNDHFLTAAEKASGQKIMPCVSRFDGRSLVLEL
jgi:ferredoxin-NADP reductase